MNELAMVLDDLVADAPVENASWSDVRARSRRRTRLLRSSRDTRRRLVIVLAGVGLLALAGTAVGVGVDLLVQQERFHASAPDDPERRGPLVEVASGDEWALIAWKSNVGVCLDFAIRGNSAFGCGFPVRGAKPATDTSGSGLPTHAVAGFVSGGGLVGGDGKTTIFGVAAREVGRVTVELQDGRVIDAPLYDASPELGVELRFFIVRLVLARQPLPPEGVLTQGPVRAYLAYDGDGRLIERIDA